jgi:Mn2+/Fe2+ NRAMP family transporter
MKNFPRLRIALLALASAFTLAAKGTPAPPEFAAVPLVLFTSDRRKMGEFASPAWVKVLAWVTAAIIIVLNVKLLADTFGLTAWLAGGK